MATAAVTEGRRPGRPRGPNRRNATVRFSPEQYAALQESADRQGRSVSEEVEVRVAKSFSDQEIREAVEHGLDGLNNGLHEVTELMNKVIAKHQARTEKLQQQITDLQQKYLRDLTDSNALAGRLYQQIVDLQKERAVDKEQLTQIVDDAVTRALRK
jgi:hypothetical protein